MQPVQKRYIQVLLRLL